MRTILLKGALVASLVVFSAWYIDLSTFAESVTPNLLLAAALILPLMGVGLLASAARFQVLVAEPRVRLKQAAKVQVLSLGFNALLPVRIAELLKVTYLRDHAGVAFSTGCAAVFLERLIDVSFLGALAGLSVLLLLSGANVAVVGIAIAAALCMIALPLLEPVVVRVLRLLPLRLARDVATAVVQHASRRSRDGALLKGVLFGAAVWGMAYLNIFLFLYVATDGRIHPEQALAVYLASLIGVAIPALPGGFGTFEAAVVFALSRFGFPLEQALAIALVLHAAQIVPFLVGALAISLRERMGIESLLRDGALALRSRDQR